MRIAILGGGVYAPKLCALLAAALPPPLTLVLHGRRRSRLEVLAAAAAARVGAGRGHEVCAVAERATALAGADAVVLLVRVGGFAARCHDELFPREFGLVGDEGLGVGGLANTWRTVPWLRALAEDLRRICPEAFVANLMAPLGATTAVLLDAGLCALGLCELPEVTRAALGHGPGEGRYGGLNHLGWFWDLPRRPGVHPLKYQARIFGDAPPALGRAEALRALDAGLFDALARDPGEVPALEAERPTPWFDRALVPALAARLCGQKHHGFANLPNAGLVEGLPAEQVVEVCATFEGAALHPRPCGPVPAAQWPLLEAVAFSERLGLAAARERDPERLRHAVRALPHPLTRAQIEALVARATEPVGEST